MTGGEALPQQRADGVGGRRAVEKSTVPSLVFRAAVYVLVAGITVLPGLVRAGGGVPGAPRSDLWNSLWSLWMPWHSDLGLNHPDGGLLIPADPLNALLLAPLTLTVGVATAWTIGVLAHLVFAALAADRLASDLGADDGGALLAGVAFQSAPLLLASVHDATSEALGWGWVPLALLALRWAMRRGGATLLVAAGALALAGFAGPYLGAAAWVGAIVTVLADERRGRGLVALVVASLAILPWAYLVGATAADPESLLGIKSPAEVAMVRRTVGAADPLCFVLVTPRGGPDVERFSRYGEDFLHTTHLGWAWLVLAVLGLRRSRRFVLAAMGVLGATLACGPVLVWGGAPLLLPGDLAVPLPYLLLEWLPGFRALSLVYRFALLAALAVALLAGLALRGRVAHLAALLGLAEVLLLSPVRGGPDASRLPDPEPLRALADGPPGAVVNHPPLPARPYLYEATIHGRPVAGSLNAGANAAGHEVLRALSDGDDAVARIAGARGIRWLVVHDDVAADPGPYDLSVAAYERRATPAARGEGIRVYRLW